MAKRARLPVQTENDWRDHTIIPYARLRGWLVYFTHRSEHSPAGWPDLVLLREEQRQMLVRELKTDRGKVTKAQTACLEALVRAGVDAKVWRPSMWEEIKEELG